MHHWRFRLPNMRILCLALVVASTTVHAQSGASGLLQEVSRLMADARANPARAKSLKCPANVGALVGAPVGQVLIELGQPGGAQDAKDNAMTYEFGKGAPVALKLRYDAQGTVKSAECVKAQ